MKSSGVDIIRNPEPPELGAVEVYINDKLIFSKLKNGGSFPRKGLIKKRLLKFLEGKNSSYYQKNSPSKKRVTDDDVITEEENFKRTMLQ